MSLNKLALIRYKTIDECLQNRFRKWTLDDLIEKVSDALFEFEGIATGISRRTIQADIQIMRGDKIGYFAPIIVTNKKYYSYSEPNYSITKLPINQIDISKMKEIVDLLKHLNGFNYFEEMSVMITKLENNIHKSTSQSPSYIQFESNKLLKGLEHINPLYQAILNKTSLLIEYKSFKAKESKQLIYYPYLLKEYRNRWFLIVRAKKGKTLITMALDRIIEFQALPNEPYVAYEGIDFDRYFGDLLGVTKSEKDRAQKVILKIDKYNTPYVLTKPIHHSQTVLKEEEDGSIILRLDVVLNFELEREILGFGENIKVLGPRILSKKIEQRLNKAKNLYSIQMKEKIPSN